MYPVSKDVMKLMNPIAPIGIFDSGLGGLAVMREVMKWMPDENILFFGDTLRQPYGPQTIEAVRKYSLEITNYLVRQGAKMVLIGCNTASIAGGNEAQAAHPDIPVIGMIDPGVSAALNTSQSKQIGIWGTEITIASQAYDRAIVQVTPDAKLVGVACSTLLRLAEKGQIDNRPYLRSLIAKDLEPVLSIEADTLILGCTDFTCVRDIIEEVVDGRMVVVDPAEEVARQALRMLGDIGSNPGVCPPRYEFLITGDDAENFSTFGAKFLDVPEIAVTRVSLDELPQLA
jgi:glutamate racemase